jgi:hypothetical protein
MYRYQYHLGAQLQGQAQRLASAAAAAAADSGASAWAVAMEARIEARFKRLWARMSNINTLYGDEPLEQILRDDGAPVPAAFPATRDALYSLTVEECDTLLDYYGLQMPAGTLVAAKRTMLSRYIGVPRIVAIKGTTPQEMSR